MAPAALAKRRVRSGSHPESSAWHKAPPKASPTSQPVYNLHHDGKHFVNAFRGAGENALRALLHCRELDAQIKQRSRSLQRVTGAHRYLDLVPVTGRHRSVPEGFYLHQRNTDLLKV